jgi:hypothetical protein
MHQHAALTPLTGVSFERSVRGYEGEMMGDTIEKKPGEKPDGKFHYNPGNQSGKTIEEGKPEAEQENNVDRIRSRGEQPKSRE